MEVVLVVQVDVPEGNAGVGAWRPYVVTAERVKVLHAGVAPHHQRQVAQVVPHMLPELGHVAVVLIIPARLLKALVSLSHITAAPREHQIACEVALC